jgi:hypothetical protein
MTSRFKPISGAVEFEALAPRIETIWDPVTEDGYVNFTVVNYMKVDGAYDLSVPPYGEQAIRANFADLMPRQFAPAGLVDPVTGADLSMISGAGMVLLFKAAFDVLYNEAHTPAPEPEPTEPESPPPAEPIAP